MVNVDEAIIARLKTHDQNFEILVDCDNALALREGKNVDMRDVLAVIDVFSDAKKGLLASENAMKQIFGTAEPEQIAKILIKKGEIQLTQEYRDRIKEQKRKQIIDIIHKNGVDPKNHLPHPVQRIENAMQEAKFHVDEYKPVQEQVQLLLKQLRPILPIKFEVKEVSVRIPPQYAPKCYPAVKGFGTMLNEEWENNGYFHATIEIPGGMESDFYEKVSKLTSGNAEIKVTKTK